MDNYIPFSSCSEDNTVLCFKKLSISATTLLSGCLHAAGFDLFSAESKVTQGHAIVKTDIAIQLPPGTYGRQGFP